MAVDQIQANTRPYATHSSPFEFVR